MPLSERYRHQVALLIETLPFVAAERDFALKGGTAIIYSCVICRVCQSIST